MVYYISHSNTIVKIWNSYFHFCKSADIRLALIYLAHEVFEQTAPLENDTYIIEFGDVFLEAFETLATNTNDLDIINRLLKLINKWKENLYYSHDFLQKLKGILDDQKSKLYQSDPKIKLNEDAVKESIKNIIDNNLCKTYLELCLNEKNIKNIYQKFELEKLDSVLNSTEPLANTMKNGITDFEERINNFRNIIIEDICKREKFIDELVDELNKEKELFFNIEEKKQNV